MEESLAEATPNIVKAMVPGFSAALGTMLRSGQDRKNLEADRAAVDSWLQTGVTNFRYRGLTMEFELFADESQKETERLVTNTVNAMLKADSVVDWSKVDLSQFNPEFRRRWISEASNVSDETLQDLWARLLAGELESPGSVSNDTMSIARDLTKERAGEFQTFCSAALCQLDGTPIIVVGCGNPGANSLEPYGLSYNVLMRLAHHRLINNEMNTAIDIGVGSRPTRVRVRQQNSAWTLLWSNETQGPDAVRPMHGILLTPAGEELFAVVEKTPNPEYTIAMVRALELEGWEVISSSKES